MDLSPRPICLPRGAHALRARFLSQFRNTRRIPRPKLHFVTPHSRKFGSVFEGPGLTDKSFCRTIFEWGLHERQRTKQTNTGVEVKKEADRDNEAKSAQTKKHQTINEQIFGQGPG